MNRFFVKIGRKVQLAIMTAALVVFGAVNAFAAAVTTPTVVLPTISVDDLLTYAVYLINPYFGLVAFGLALGWGIKYVRGMKKAVH